MSFITITNELFDILEDIKDAPSDYLSAVFNHDPGYTDED